MGIERHERIKSYIARMLSYYGFDVSPEWRLPNDRRIDIVARYSNEILIGVEVELTSNLKDDINRLTSMNLNYRFIVSDKTTRDIESGILKIEIFSSEDLLSLEEKIRQIINVRKTPRYKEVELRIENNDSCEEIVLKLDKIIDGTPFDLSTIKNVIYYEELVSQGSGKVGVYGGRGAFSQEHSFLSSLGVWDYDYLTNTDLSKWSRARACIVKQVLSSHTQEIYDIVDSHPKHFNYIMLIGTLGHIRYGNWGFGFKLHLMENFEKYSGLLPVSFNEQYWLGRVCEVDYKTTFEYYQEWEGARISVRTDVDYYIPLVPLIKESIADIATWDTFDRKLLGEFALWSLIKDMIVDYERKREYAITMIRDSESLKPLLAETSKLGLTSDLLPDESKEMFAIYDKNALSKFCDGKVLDYAKRILSNN
jgi:hypothetical protein